MYERYHWLFFSNTSNTDRSFLHTSTAKGNLHLVNISSLEMPILVHSSTELEESRASKTIKLKSKHNCKNLLSSSEIIVAKNLNRNALHTIPFATLLSETQDNCVILHKWRVSTSSLNYGIADWWGKHLSLISSTKRQIPMQQVAIIP